jgi:hypothetical protein
VQCPALSWHGTARLLGNLTQIVVIAQKALLLQERKKRKEE